MVLNDLSKFSESKILEQGLLYIISWWAGSVNEAKSTVTQH